MVAHYPLDPARATTSFLSHVKQTFVEAQIHTAVVGFIFGQVVPIRLLAQSDNEFLTVFVTGCVFPGVAFFVRKFTISVSAEELPPLPHLLPNTFSFPVCGVASEPARRECRAADGGVREARESVLPLCPRDSYGAAVLVSASTLQRECFPSNTLSHAHSATKPSSSLSQVRSSKWQLRCWER